MSAPELAQILHAIAHSKRYRHIAPSIVTRLAVEEIPKSKNAADAEKRTKRRLHQIFGAFARPMPYEKLLKTLKDAAQDPTRFKDQCADIQKLHASTAERLPDLERFYTEIFQITGKPIKLLDLACGLHPLSVPWMNLSPNAFYVAVDIDAQMAHFVDRFLALAPGIHGIARVCDLVAGPPGAWADVAFLLKSLPVLQHQTDDVLKILDRVKAPWLVISFPTKSLGNKSKGMIDTYRATMQDLLKSRPWKPHELLFPSELVYVIKKS
jgi:16S rRNA (guanine(1405)-N(7))-methyltransferase